MHSRFGLLHKLELMRDFLSVTIKRNEQINNYMGRLMKVHRNLSKADYEFTDIKVALVMLMKLPATCEALSLDLE